MTIKAALIDDQGIFLRMVDVASKAELTDRHIASITECDLPPNAYKWVPNSQSPHGGAFMDVIALSRRSRPDFDKAFAALCQAVEAGGIKIPDETSEYLNYAGKRHARRARATEKGK